MQTSFGMGRAYAGSDANDTESHDYEKKVQEFIEMMAAVLHRFGTDAISMGYRIVFFNEGPENLEELDPELFIRLTQAARVEGVEFRGLGKLITGPDGAYVDDDTGARGVCFLPTSFEEDHPGEYLVKAEWSSADGERHDVVYRLAKKDGKWGVED